MKCFKNCVVLLLFTLISVINYAQVNGGVNEKLRELYNLDKFEDCVFKAEKMTQSDKYSRDPEPYLYLAMCFYKISFLDPEELDNRVKDPLAESLKYALKYTYKDRKKELYDQNIPFLNNLKHTTVINANNAIQNGDYRAASNLLNNLSRIEEDPAVDFYKGVCDINNRNSSGNRLIQKSLDLYHEKKADTLYYKSLSEGSVAALSNATLLFCSTLKSQDLLDSAKQVSKLAFNLIPSDASVKQNYESLWGIESKDPKFKNGFQIKYESHVSDPNQPIPPRDSTKLDSIQPNNQVPNKEEQHVEN